MSVGGKHHMVVENQYTYQNLIGHIKHLDSSKEHMIILMLAPYNEKRVKDVVDQYYDYWNIKYTTDTIHFYWLGYILADQEKRFRLKVKEDLYFDIHIFNDIIQDLNKKWSFQYRDKFEMIIVKYKNNKLDFKDHIRIDLEKIYELSQLKELIAYIYQICEEYKSFYSLKIAIKQKLGRKRLRKIDAEILLQIFNMILTVR